MFLNYLTATLSVLAYLYGFFPIPARPSQQTFTNNVTAGSPKHPKAVLIVIDALRLDFISDSGTPFLAKAYKNNGCFIQIKVESPTVTLPRIKALTTGNVPQFVDIILNLASPTKVEDSFIHRAHSNGKRIVFYGDDIWVRLFPEEFLRSEGTSSFFVNDFTEVDDNVTRNVKMELQRGDWNIMILHYLGLDHIGHVYGPKSPLISTKLREMDSIIQQIHTEDTLLLVTGDHGMRDSGGHGGSTHPETNVPLIVVGAPCRNDTFPQTDIPANLAILSGFDIPATSIGQLQDSLMQSLSDLEHLQALRYNMMLLRSKLDLCGEEIVTADHYLELFALSGEEGHRDRARETYKKCAKDISQRLQSTSVQQNLGALITATATAIVILIRIVQVEKGGSTERVFVLATLLMQFWDFPPEVSLTLATMSVLNLVRTLGKLNFNLKTIEWSFFTVLSIVHPFIFLSSSFLEEEHQYWYFFTNTFIILKIVTGVGAAQSWIVLAVAIRFARSMNQVGDKWAAVPDLSDWLLKEENYPWLQIVFIVGLLSTFYSSASKSAIDAVILMLIYVFRTIAREHPTMGQTIWLLIFLRFVCSFTSEGVLPAWLLSSAILLKPYNVILIPICIYGSSVFHSSLDSPNSLVMAHYWLGNLLFFAQGHDNSLASVDIASGYIGLTEYNPAFVVPQVLSHTYTFPVLTHLLLFRNPKVNPWGALSTFAAFRLHTTVVVFLVTFVHRHHLFIWSVFAPKIFVEASHFGFLFIEISCYYLHDLIKNILKL